MTKTYLVTKQINALVKIQKTYTDAIGRTIQTADALGKITSYTYDDAGNQLSESYPGHSGTLGQSTYDQVNFTYVTPSAGYCASRTSSAIPVRMIMG